MAKLVIGVLVSGALIIAVQVAFGDYDDERGASALFERSSSVDPARDPQYVAECGACHIAYPPGLLPARSWEKIMAQLSDHFGDNAELDDETHRALRKYLVQNGAERDGHRHSRKIARSVDGSSTPVRITEVPYIRHEHHEIPQRLVANNPQVKSFSNCGACHQQIERGSFSEREIRIPGFGRWDD